MRAVHSLLWLSLLGLAPSVFATESFEAPGQSGEGWSGCRWNHSQHLSTRSDAGSDNKFDALLCSRERPEAGAQILELGMMAETPPIGGRGALKVDGKPQVVSGYPSDQVDTFSVFAGFGQSYVYQPRSLVGYHARLGLVNGPAANLVRGFWDAEHRGVAGIDHPRHSPLSSGARPLAQLTLLHSAEWLGTVAGRQRLAVSGIEALSVGTRFDGLTLGVLASLHGRGGVTALPANLPGMPLPTFPGNYGYAGVFLQETVYDQATNYTGTRQHYSYVRAGGQVQLGKSLVLGVELTHPLTDRVIQQRVKAYNYLSTSLGWRF